MNPQDGPLIRALLPIADVLLLPFVYAAAWLLKGIRGVGVQRMPLSKQALLQVGVFPIRRHYYEPQFDTRDADPAFSAERGLPGIDWNVTGQLEWLERLRYAGELAGLPDRRTADPSFHFNNGFFESGDAEYWYQVVRAVRPQRIIEIGSGYSTLLAMRAIRRTRDEDPGYGCEHTCVEPYAAAWLEHAGLSVVRERAERTDRSLYAQLGENDILFIDSSHVIRPQGDVLFEYLELLPTLKPGVIVHVHDIFSPRNYPAQWLTEEVRLWNEQYLLEALLSGNRGWRVIGALNYLHHNHYEKLKAVAPYLTPEREPGSFYIQRVAA